MGSKPSSAAADQANALAAQQAAEARQKEIERQARLDTGYKKIKETFEGAPVMGTKQQAFDWSGIAAPTAQVGANLSAYADSPFARAQPGATGTALPEGFTWVSADAPTAPVAPGARGAAPVARASFSQPYALNGMIGGGTNQGSGGRPPEGPVARSGAAVTPGGGKVWAVRGPDGQIHYVGDKFGYSTQFDTGKRTGGFGEDFYGGIGKSVTDLGMTDITDQYNKARENLQYALARQGITTSSAGNQGAADVEAAKTKARGDLALQAKQASNQVRNQVDQERAAAISQLYATEDPTIAANTALTKSQNIRADQPAYNSLGDIFGSVISSFGNLGSAARASGYFGAQKSPTVRPAGG